jgi:hypothetical protein
MLASHPDLTALVAVDDVVTQILRAPLQELAGHRPATIVTTVDSMALDLLSRSLVDAVIGSDTCAMVRTAMTNAVLAAKNQFDAINPGPVVAVQTITGSHPAAADIRCN